MTILGLAGVVVAALIAAVILYLVVVIFAPGFSVPEQPLQGLGPAVKDGADSPSDRPPPSRRDVRFDVGGKSLSGWLYLPQDLSAPVPCIVMNHGLGGTKDMALEAYAVRFQNAGMAVLTYDYRYFGESEGEPRQLFSIPDQLEDCTAAIEYVRGLPEVDPDRVALWGTSAAGGYGLVIAAQDKGIACVCAQCSALDSEEDGKLALKREGIGFFLRLFVHAQRDKGRSRFGLSPHRIPIVGKPRSTAMITAPGAIEGYSMLASESLINQICARVLLMTHGYNPIDHAEHVRCPVLLQICEKDNLVSMGSGLRTAELLGKFAHLKQYPIGHFDIYFGEHFDRAVKDQLEFFERYV
jgi:fermentation-respiration switch protein FrsA (DUF1100 family)